MSGMNELEKYTALWDLPQGYGNNYDDERMIEIVKTLTREMGLHTFTSVIDIGGGDQRLAKFFPNHKYTCLDIAPNATPCGENAYAHIVADVSDWFQIDEYEWGISIDVMEHLPTDRVDLALENISLSCSIGCVFLICTRPDRGGKKIGETLHMTVQPAAWWIGMMAKYFHDVKLIRNVIPEYCLIVGRGNVWD